MKNRYRIQNKHGQVLCYQDTAQLAGDVVCNLGRVLCRTHMIVDTKNGVAFPYTTIKPDTTGLGFVGTPHKNYEDAASQLI